MNQNDVHGDRLAVLTTLPRCSASPEVAPASWSARRCSQGAPSGIPQLRSTTKLAACSSVTDGLPHSRAPSSSLPYVGASGRDLLGMK